MKRITLLFVGLTVMFTSFGQDHEENDNGGITKKIPAVILQDMEGNTVNTSEMGFDGPVIISFWATWCTPCKRELNTINELYPDWQDETGVTLVAVSVDDERTKSKVEMYVNGKAWDYFILMDPNSDFKRAMGVNNVPHTFLIDTNGNVVYTHNNYAPGDEEVLYEELLKLVQ